MCTLHSVIDDMLYIEDSNNNLGTLIIVGNMKISAYSTENGQLMWMKDDTIAGTLLNSKSFNQTPRKHGPEFDLLG